MQVIGDIHQGTEVYYEHQFNNYYDHMAFYTNSYLATFVLDNLSHGLLYEMVFRIVQ